MEVMPVYLTGIVALLLFSSFVKVLTTLPIFRTGLGLNTTGFGVVVVGISILLSLLVVSPSIGGEEGLDQFFNPKKELSLGALDKKFSPFIDKNTDPKILEKLSRLVPKDKVEKDKSVSTVVKKGEVYTEKEIVDEIVGDNSVEDSAEEGNVGFLMRGVAFVISELTVAFQLGVMLLIPFIVIDLLVANLLTALGVTQISHLVVSLPLKLLLFFSIDGWTLLTEKLISGYM